MRHYGRSSIWCTVSLVAAGLACLPIAALAETAPAMMVERTPQYTVVLAVGPAVPIMSPMDAMHGQMGEVAVTGGDAAMMANHMDQGMAINHNVNVHIALADSDSVVMDVTPTIRVTDKSTGVTRELPAVMGMYGSSMGTADFHYGQNVFLPDGTYLVRVMIGESDAALFRDVAVMGGSMMADDAMSHNMNTSTPP